MNFSDINLYKKTQEFFKIICMCIVLQNFMLGGGVGGFVGWGFFHADISFLVFVLG